MRKRAHGPRKSFLFLSFLFISLSLPASAAAAKLYFIDAHSQMDEDVEPAKIISLMDRAGVYRTILAARRGRTPRDVIRFAQTHPERIIPSVTTKKWGYVREAERFHKKYYAALRNQARSGKFRAMAEVLMWHSGCPNDKCPAVRVTPGDKRVQAALQAALANGWPFVAHIEFGSLWGAERRLFKEGFKKMLAAHAGHPFALIHMGQLGPAEVRELIGAHRNLHFLAAHSNPIATGMAVGVKPWVNMFEEDKLAPAWRKLILEHPDRFVFALDNVWGSKHWQTQVYTAQVGIWRRALAGLPERAARAFAHGNAERLWRLPPKAGAAR